MRANSDLHNFTKRNPVPEMVFIQLTKVELKEMIDIAISEALSKHTPTLLNSSNETYLTRADVAKMFQVTLTAINKWSRTGKLNRHYIGSRVYFLRSEIDALFRSPTKFKKHNDGLQVISRKTDRKK
ncbi:MAG: helix-turn-helix domain-containing protein [Bacteroidetes bacterium]|nr:helix-turn-helix domain-containing protein [Bacteroidota bacterium]MBP7306350.1 helix-turn-helix domain-containing protein [Saprospiraceae bacterium]